MRALLLTLALAALPATALASDVGGFLFAEWSATDDRETALSLPGVELSSRSAETSVVVDGRQGGLRYRLRIEAFGAVEDGWPDKGGIELKELSYGAPLDEAWTISVGLQQRSWDSGLSYQPLGFFRSRTDLTDPFDTEARQEGLPMVVVTRLGETVNFEAIVSDRISASTRPERLNGRQWAVRLSGEPLPALNTAVALRQRSGAPIGVGVSASYAKGQFEFHVDAFYGPGEATLAYAGLSDPQPRLHFGDPFRTELRPPSSLKSVIGATWTPTQELELRLEWAHRGDAPSDAERIRFFDAVVFHRAALSGPYGGVAFANLAQDLAASRLLESRDQVFAMASLSRGRIGYRVSALYSLDDGGALLTAGVSGPIAYGVSGAAGAALFRGAESSRFGALPFRGSVYASLSRAF